MTTLHERLLGWYDENARDLPWRQPAATAWAVLVSEVMLQQTPVSRVLPVFAVWMQQWPTPSALAGASTGDAVRAWGRLGYPRRALRLHSAANAIVVEHGGEVPSSYEHLHALPGVGDYTAAAVASFAFGQRHPVLDTNVRRVFARAVTGDEFAPVTVTKAERVLATDLLPDEPATAAAWNVAVMELGALVCTANGPACGTCPVQDICRWRLSDYPRYAGPPRHAQTYAGTDRQCRGQLLHVLREAVGTVHRSRLEVVWSNDHQRERCLASLVEDGLAAQVGADIYALP